MKWIDIELKKIKVQINEHDLNVAKVELLEKAG